MNVNVLSLILEAQKKKIEILHKNREGINALIKNAAKIRSLRDSVNRENKISVIAEIKQASPSAGVLRRDFSPVDLALGFQAAGARALSVLTEEEFFLGKKSYLTEIRSRVDLPLLRKDFIIDEIQVLESRALGADAILLIMRILDEEKYGRLSQAARDLGMEVLVEVHTQKELRKVLKYPVDMIGINNRNLQTLKVDLRKTKNIAPFIPPEIVKVGMSGISSVKDMLLFKGIGLNAVLIGEALMKETDPAAKLSQLNIDAEP